MGGVEEGDTLDELRVHAGQTIDRDDGSEGEEDGEEEDNGETEDEASARDNTSMVEAGASTPAFASRAGGKAGKGPVLETAKLDRITWDPGGGYVVSELETTAGTQLNNAVIQIGGKTEHMRGLLSACYKGGES